MGLIIISFVQTSKLAYKYRLRLWIYVRDSPLIYRVSHSFCSTSDKPKRIEYTDRELWEERK